MLQQRFLDASALLYITKCLEQGKTLSALLLQHLNFSEGKVWTYLPPEINDDKVYQFNYGGITEPSSQKEPIENGYANPVLAPSKPSIINLVKTYLSNEIAACCVIENLLAHPKDEWLSKQKDQSFLFFQSDVYYFLDDDNSNEEKIEQAFRENSSYLLTAILTRVSNSLNSNQSQQHISFNELQSFVDNTSTLIIKAYDGEGYLIWSRA